jgi:hypothetical protein
MSLVWWHMPIILALGNLREEDRKFEFSLAYIARPCLLKGGRGREEDEVEEKKNLQLSVE